MEHPYFRDNSPFDNCLDYVKDYPSIFTDVVMAYFLNLAGVGGSVPHVLRLGGMATQKFVSDIGTSALRYCALRNNWKLDDPEGKLTLTLEDLNRAFEDYNNGLNVTKKPEYYV